MMPGAQNNATQIEAPAGLTLPHWLYGLNAELNLWQDTRPASGPTRLTELPTTGDNNGQSKIHPSPIADPGFRCLVAYPAR
ncbi:hypothetical protein ACJ2_26910 [Pantoea sp. QMID2]|nr:hypothetical protein ACJ3_30500 [Pantoea sp. QMID3]GME58836.1 hypothetical protein ACJ2_26910 [Pantoea sp. QMID2]